MSGPTGRYSQLHAFISSAGIAKHHYDLSLRFLLLSLDLLFREFRSVNG